MVTPSDNWNDTETGYETDSVSVDVYPAVIDTNDGSITAVDDSDGDLFVVTVSYLNGDRIKRIAIFLNPRDAWEFTHHLTHYIDDNHVSDVVHSWALPYTHDVSDTVITDSDPDEVLDAIVGKQVMWSSSSAIA